MINRVAIFRGVFAGHCHTFLALAALTAGSTAVFAADFVQPIRSVGTQAHAPPSPVNKGSEGVAVTELTDDFTSASLPSDKERFVIGILLGEIPDRERDAIDLELGVGLLIKDVLKEKPAAAAGLLPGDILLSLNGESVGEVQDVVRIVNSLEGAAVEVALVRETAVKTVKVVPVQLSERELGTVHNLSPKALHRLKSSTSEPSLAAAMPDADGSAKDAEIRRLKKQISALEARLERIEALLNTQSAGNVQPTKSTSRLVEGKDGFLPPIIR